MTLVVVGLLVAACERVGGFEEFERGEKQEAGGHPCNVLPATKVDEERGSLMVRVNLTNGSCFWIDRTEVTVAQYEHWVTSGSAKPFPADRCSWKTAASTPSKTSSPSEACPDKAVLDAENDHWNKNKPIRCVDWCDAQAFCDSASKLGARLCYSYEAALAPKWQDAEWKSACSHGFSQAYPYGDAPCDDCCNLDNSEACMPKCGVREAGALAACSTPSGVRDMLGNVWEWGYMCEELTDAGPSRDCRILGGSYESTDTSMSCNELGDRRPMGYRGADTGFRCCLKVSDAELYESLHK